MIKLLFVLVALMPALASLPSSYAPPKYAGHWKLNREKSEGLTGGLAGAEILLIVSQDDRKIFVEQKVKIRGHQQPSQELIWNLDGSETSAEVSRPMAGTMSLKARWLENLRTLELYSSITGNDQGKEVAVVTKESWELLNNGKSLRILRSRNAPQGRQTFKLHFDRIDP
ncbi:MAG: hypothetical protein SF339_19135 [Blastocatellia bacterium]|nr:hypothetical protein [Blastocatellia bacterium]